MTRALQPFIAITPDARAAVGSSLSAYKCQKRAAPHAPWEKKGTGSSVSKSDLCKWTIKKEITFGHRLVAAAQWADPWRPRHERKEVPPRAA